MQVTVKKTKKMVPIKRNNSLNFIKKEEKTIISKGLYKKKGLTFASLYIKVNINISIENLTNHHRHYNRHKSTDIYIIL